MIRQIEDKKFQIEAYAYYQGKRFKKRETFHGTLKQAREREAFLRVQLREKCKTRMIKRAERLKTFSGLINFCKEHNRFKRSMQYYEELVEKDCSDFPIDQLKDKFIQYVL